ncbi:hypothetical protein TNCV_141041 [Trichonephila clavipes]|nr:hypothetical protein TNCV_141041 [Trichonephila clavipes]
MPQFWQSSDWYLLHDSAPAHRSQLVKEFLTKTRSNALPYTPYSSDLAQCDFYRFPSMKKHLQGRREAVEKSFRESSIERDLTRSCKKWLPALFPEVIRTLTEVYCHPRGLL